MTVRKQLGFTLVEVITVVLIIGVLAAIAYPSYVGMMQRSRRAEAATIINEQSLRLEKFRVDNASYGDYWDAPQGVTETDFYTVDGEGDADGYTVVATPKNGPQKSDPCGALTLTFAGGAIERSDEAGGAEDCW